MACHAVRGVRGGPRAPATARGAGPSPPYRLRPKAMASIRLKLGDCP